MYPATSVYVRECPLPCAVFIRQSEMRVTVKHIQEKAQRELAEVTEQVRCWEASRLMNDSNMAQNRRSLSSMCACFVCA